MAIVTTENILKLLYSYNPWWRETGMPKEHVRPMKRFAFFEAWRMLNYKDIRRFVLLSGARRVGKTTLLYQMIEKLLDEGVPCKNILYVTFDHPLLKFATMDALMEMYKNNVSGVGPYYLFFDEIQYAKDWELWLKVFYDQNPDWKITATGSASPVISQGASDSGVGRWSVIPVPTLSFYEYCELLQLDEVPQIRSEIRPTALVGISQPNLIQLMNQLAPLQKHFLRYLTVGGFPELALASDDFYAQRILREDVVDKVLKRDMPSLFNIRNIETLEKLFLYLCFHSSNIINIATISKELDGTSALTISNYIQYLEQSNLIYISMPVSLDGKKILKAKPKIYIADAAIRNAVLMLEPSQFSAEEMGVMVETAVYKHLASFYYRTNTAVGYYRKTGGKEKEIDVVVEFPAGRILTEVKYRENSTIPETDAIVEQSRMNDPRIQAALVITRRAEDYGVLRHDTSVPIMRIPAHAFLFLLGHAEKMGYMRGVL